MLRDEGVLIYYDTVLQPLGVRLGTEAETSQADLDRACGLRGIIIHRVVQPDLVDPRMQNIAVLACIHQQRLVPGLETEHFMRAMDDLLEGPMLAANTKLFQSAS
jgi:indolepyruvate ferredoxin oxidoreductase beta subunit